VSLKSDCGCAVDWDAAANASRRLLVDAYRIDLRKALDPLDPHDFLALTHGLATELQQVSGPIERRMIDGALAALDVDWLELTDAQRVQVVHAVNLSMRNIPPQILPEVTSTVTLRLTEMVEGTKVSAAGTMRATIATSLDAIDEDAVAAIGRISQWVTDEYGRRGAMFEMGADRIIADGLAAGLRSRDITADLAAHGRKVGVTRAQSYWKLVALNAANRARSYGHLRSMSDAGVSQYIFSAVMDERTSVVCRALDGTTFPVSGSLNRFSDLAIDSEGDYTAAEKVMPFVKERALDGGGVEMFVEPPGMGRTVIATASDRGLGRADYRPEVRDKLPPAALQAAGVSVPPLHQACRSSIIPDV
jgi:SPP1 gp7 family putative phage head morphogenesis protein